jgi:hypothetical protein
VYRINWEIYKPYAGESGLLQHRKRKHDPVNVTKETQERSSIKCICREKKQRQASKAGEECLKEKEKKSKFKINDQVRISYLKHAFQREYDQKWNGEVFIITHRYHRQSVDVYKLKDY